MKTNRKIHLVGNAHLDPVWLWRWQEGYAEIKATFRSALDRMKEFPDFKFTSACAAYYKWIEENSPEMFEEIKQRVQEGRWVIAGGWWIQPDCNIPSGESFARHALYSQRYFLEKFGVISKVGYNVDSFGHNDMLPQILKKSGMDYYLFMRPMKHEKELTSDLFWWESKDGSRVMTYRLPTSYGEYWDGHTGNESEELKILETIKVAERTGVDMMGFYGVGNHGGGPTIENLKMIHRLQEEWGEEALLLSSPNEYFDSVSSQNPDIPVVKDDLQMHAMGCYSAHSATKASNREAEHRLVNAEKFSAIAHELMGLEYPKEKISRAWEQVLFNQFHDIMGGCSIKEAYKDAMECYGEALHLAAEAQNSALQKMSWAIDTMKVKDIQLNKINDWALWEIDNLGIPLVVFNPLSWPVHAPVQVNKKLSGITDETGNIMQIQTVRGAQTNKEDKWDTLFMGDVPAMGYRVYWIYKDKEFAVTEQENALSVSDDIMENQLVKLEFDAHTGYIKSLYNKKDDVQILASKGAVPVVIDEYHCDTWAHDEKGFHDEIGRFSDAEIKVLEAGPLRARVRVTSRYNLSTLQQDFILYGDSSDIEVRVKLNWQEKHKLLKLSFPVNVKEPSAFCEIPYGYGERDANGHEKMGHQWLDVSGKNEDKNDAIYGLSLLNDSKYSFDIKDNDMRLTVLRGAIYADHYGVRDEFCEFMDQGIHEFRYMLVPHAGTWKEAGVVRKAHELNTSLPQVIETYHNGVLPQRLDGIHISSEGIIASVFKKAEDGEGYILRCYETLGQDTETEISIPVLDRKWKTSFGKCEIKTFFIPSERQMEISEKNLIEM